MKNTRSLLAFFLAAMMCLALAACGGDKAPASYTLTADQADLSNTASVVVEPDAAPYNLGGWDYYDIVAFHFTGIEQDGEYSITLELSKAASDGDEALILITDEINGIEHEGAVSATGEDWSTYVSYTMPTNVYVSGGKADLSIEANYDHVGDYFINLRSVTLTYVGEGTPPAPTPDPDPDPDPEPLEDVITLEDIDGWWETPDYPDVFYFSGSGYWETYEEDGSLFLEGDLIDNGDSTFTLIEVDMGEYGILVADVEADTLVLYTEDGYTFYFAPIDAPF